MKTRTMTNRELAELLDELDVKATQENHSAHAADSWVNRRRSDRRPFRTRCTVTYWDAMAREPADLQGRTRNLSRLGFSVLAPREFTSAEPVEVSFSMAGSEPLFMSGLVCFCRYAGRGYYEVGVSLRHAGSASILHLPPNEANEAHAWLRHAIASI